MSNKKPHSEIAKMRIKTSLLKKMYKHSPETIEKMRKPHNYPKTRKKRE